MRSLIMLCLLLFIVPMFGQNQNIVPNPNFHAKTICPGGSNWTVQNWYNTPASSSSDYYNICGLPNSDVPTNAVYGTQESETGDAYIGMITRNLIGGEFREYAEVQLAQPMFFGGCYELFFSYNRADISGATNNLGMLMGNGNLPDYSGQVPQLEVTTLMNDSINWIGVSGQYIATGNESTVTIGNFRNNSQTMFIPGPNSDAYYFIDSVSVRYIGVESANVPIELGPDINICTSDLPAIISSNNPSAINSWSTGAYGNSIAVNESGIYYVTVYDECEYNVDSVVVNIFEEPELELEDQEFCEGESYVINLDPSLGTYNWSTGLESPNITITETGSYWVLLNHDCGSKFEMFDVKVSEQIDIPEFEDFYECTPNMPLLVPLFIYDDGVNEFDWSTGSDESVVFLTEGGSYSVEVSNECFVQELTFDVFVSDLLPDSIVFVDTLLCPGNEVTINTGISDAEFLWDDGSSEAMFVADQPGIYTVIARNYCEEKTYTFEIFETEEFDFELGADISLCPGDSALLVSPNGQNILWSNGTTSQEIWVQNEGFVVGEFQGACGIIKDSVLVQLNGEGPQITLPDSIQLCMGDSILVSAGSVNSGIDFIWNTGSSSHEIYISEPGIYDVVGSNSCGNDGDSIVIFMGELLPTVSIEELYTICPGDSIYLDVNPGNSSVLWSSGSQDSSEQFMLEGIHMLSLENDCYSQVIEFEITFEETLEDFDLGEDQSICIGESALLGAPMMNGTYLWNTMDNTNSIEVFTPGEYILEIEGICNIVTDTIEVIDLGDEPTVSLMQNLEICEGDSLDLPIIGTEVESIIWNTGDTTESIQIFEEGTYIVEVSNVCGTSIDSTSLIFDLAVPQIDLGDDQLICEGDSILLDVGLQSGTITWNTGDDGQSIYVREEGWYGALLSSSCGESTDSVFISTLAAPVGFTLGNDTTICEGTSFAINFPELAVYNVEWQDGTVVPSETLDNAQTYWMSISNSCGEQRDSIDIDFHPRINEFSFDPVDDLCAGESVVLEGFQDNVLEYTWQDNSSESNFTVLETGLYSLSIEGYCESFDAEVEVNFIELENLQPAISPSYLYCIGETLTLDLESSGVDGILWNDGSTDFERSFTEAGEYIFELFNFCQDSTYRFDIIFEDCISELIYVPNIFTPNGDGNNEAFSIEIPSDFVNPSVEASIFNRWGERMFYSEDKDFSWDGSFKGKTLNPGVYVYLILIEVEINNEIRRFDLQGDITIAK